MKKYFNPKLIKSQVILFAATLLLILIFFSALVFYQNNKISQKSSQLMKYEFPLTTALTSINSDINRQAFSLRGNVIRKDTAWQWEREARWANDIFPNLKIIDQKKAFFSDSVVSLVDSLHQAVDLYREKELEVNDWILNNYVNGTNLSSRDSLFVENYERIANQERQVLVPMVSKLSSIQGRVRRCLEPLLAYNQEQMKADIDSINQKLKQTNNILFGIIIFTLIVAVLSALRLIRSVVGALKQPTELLQKLSLGELTEQINYEDNEIGEIVKGSNQLSLNLNSASNFAQSIGEGNFDFQFKPTSEKDILGNALVQMRNKLKLISEEDRKRNWTTEGLARFAEISRKYDDIKSLGLHFISGLVKYLNINQGGLFIFNDEDESNPFLELIGCYAFDRVKHVQKKVAIGQGLVGQCYREGETIYLLEIPQDYIFIRSGLGGANPKSILVVPLKVNDKIEGIVELASFDHFEKFEIEFVEKVSEVIASTFSSMKINVRTKRLLEESQQRSEEMKSQEEEMRQNMEELEATQEEMHRKQNEINKLLQESTHREDAYKEQIKQLESQHALQLKAMSEELEQLKAADKSQ
ncbi:MAG: GAF domain-containing protein [Candidatus Cyclobacteriaceae bacterium M3_2C_046]